ncbi:GDSL-type esterase/lipase family protein [Christiangramia sabulilitoris]|uniref:Sialate O-acetylesterase n=1 Tax=Christiangramia sabulilitoris TaxID=2583991 RepID=A0A550I0Q6_9FLAO|nr:GDSL-type esterase/lipase family protein [Christiangramia sabulilitoris]TRO64520.1 sialate O-acetylesterase [Christiangramia sabulilitoris]
MGNKSNNSLFLGDSLTEFGNWEDLLPAAVIYNQGISGDLSSDVLDRLDMAINLEPAKIFLMIGVNDLAQEIPVGNIRNNIISIGVKLKGALPSSRLYLQSILPINPGLRVFQDGFDYSENIRLLNSLLKTECKDPFYEFIDLHPEFANEAGHLKGVYTTDGLHLNNAGYQRWAEILKRTGNF